MKKIDENKFIPDMTIHTSIETPCRVDKKNVDLIIIWSDILLYKP